jgi:hypothetical protein
MFVTGVKVALEKIRGRMLDIPCQRNATQRNATQDKSNQTKYRYLILLEQLLLLLVLPYHSGRQRSHFISMRDVRCSQRTCCYYSWKLYSLSHTHWRMGRWSDTVRVFPLSWWFVVLYGLLVDFRSSHPTKLEIVVWKPSLSIPTSWMTLNETMRLIFTIWWFGNQSLTNKRYHALPTILEAWERACSDCTRWKFAHNSFCFDVGESFGSATNTRNRRGLVITMT